MAKVIEDAVAVASRFSFQARREANGWSGRGAPMPEVKILDTPPAASGLKWICNASTIRAKNQYRPHLRISVWVLEAQSVMGPGCVKTQKFEARRE